MTPDLSVLRDLKARVEGAEGEDCRLDRDLGVALWGWRRGLSAHAGHPGMLYTHECSTLDDDGAIIPSPTESVDTAIALVEHVTPREISDHVRAAYSDLAKRFAWHMRRSEPGQMAVLPRAILGSMLASLIAKAERSSALDAMVEIAQVEKMP